MGLPVSLETRDASVTLTTRVTHIGFFTMMYMSMKFHVNPLGIVPTAGGATVGFFPSVQAEVGFEITRGTYPFATNFALMGFFTCVYKSMLVSVCQLCKGLVTFVTMVR